MTAAQRRWHARIWCAVALVTAAVLALAWLARCVVPVNAELPAALASAPVAKGD